jgi:hypothetical protein
MQDLDAANFHHRKSAIIICPFMTGMKTKQAAAAVILLALIAAGWLWWRTTPRHTLGRIKHAIAHHDVASFRANVDLDALLGRAMVSLAGNRTPGEDLSSEGLALVAGPFMVAQAKTMIETWVASGNWPAAGDSTGAGLARVRDFEYRGMGKSEGGRLALRFHHAKYGRDLEVVLKFESAGLGEKRLVEIANLGELAEELARSETEWRDAQNQPALEKITAVLKLDPIEKRTSGGFWVADRRYHLWLNVTNIGDRDITAIAGKFLISAAAVPDRTRVVLASFDPIALAPGGELTLITSVEVSPLDPSDQAIFTTPLDQLEISFIPSRVTFSDGSSLAIPYP